MSPAGVVHAHFYKPSLTKECLSFVFLSHLLSVAPNDRQSEPRSSANNASPSTSDRCAFSTGEHDQPEASDVLNDLGCIIKPSMCCEEVSHAVSELSAAQKYKLLTDHYKPNADFPFPGVFAVAAIDPFSTKG